MQVCRNTRRHMRDSFPQTTWLRVSKSLHVWTLSFFTPRQCEFADRVVLVFGNRRSITQSFLWQIRFQFVSIAEHTCYATSSHDYSSQNFIIVLPYIYVWVFHRVYFIYCYSACFVSFSQHLDKISNQLKFIAASRWESPTTSFLSQSHFFFGQPLYYIFSTISLFFFSNFLEILANSLTVYKLPGQLFKFLIFSYFPNFPNP